MKSLLPLGLLALSTTCAFAAEPAPRDDSAAEKLGWHLATKAYTFRDITLFETIDISRQLGVKYFEVNPGQKLSPENPIKTDDKLPAELREAIKKKFAEAGVKPVNFGVANFGKTEESARSVFQYAHDLGIETIVAEPTEQMMDTVDKLCGEFNINVAIHNHPAPSHYNAPQTVLDAIKGHSAHLGSCADVGHWTRSGFNAVDCLHQLAGHVISLHFKDVNAAKQDVPLGEGLTDVKGMLAELHRQNFHGVFALEYEPIDKAHLLNDIKKEIAYFDEVARAEAK